MIFLRKQEIDTLNLTLKDLRDEIDALKKRIAILETPFKFSVGEKIKVDMCGRIIPITNYVIVERRRDFNGKYSENYYVCYSDKLKMSFDVRESDIKSL